MWTANPMCDYAHISTDVLRGCMLKQVATGIPEGTGPNQMSRATHSSSMRTLRTVEELRAALVPDRREGRTIGLVPTMGALHEGHLSLIGRAREQCDRVVVSLFVNPAQFNERSDLERYPREERRDARLAAAAGADLLFAPSVEEVYPPGFATSVEVLRRERAPGGRGARRGALPRRRHGRHEAALHGVNPTSPTSARRTPSRWSSSAGSSATSNLPVRIEACPTVREPDGLAMSSRNALLDARERERALALYGALRAIEDYAARGERRAARLLEAGHQRLAARGVDPEYLALVDPDTLERLEWLDRRALPRGGRPSARSA